jgi:hypothetical protein
VTDEPQEALREPLPEPEIEADPEHPVAALDPAGPSPTGAAPLGFSYRHRAIVLGRTTSGKSTLINAMFEGYRCQRVLVDTKDEWRIAGVEPVHKPGEIDWTQPIIHYIDDGGRPEDYDKLFKILRQRRQGRVAGPKTYGLKVAVHELADLCADTPGRAGTYVAGYWRKGAAHGQGVDAGSQRPVNIPKIARTEVEHVLVMEAPFDPEDEPTIAAALGVTIDRLRELQAQARSLGQHAYIWRPKGLHGHTHKLYLRPPLPAGRVETLMVQGLD